MLITVGYGISAIRNVYAHYAHITLAATDRCQYCVVYERVLPIYVLSGATRPVFPRLWPKVKSFD